MTYLFGQASRLPFNILVPSRYENNGDKQFISIGPHLCLSSISLPGNDTYRAAISASCSAALTAASSSSLDKGLLPFLSLAYHVRSLPFCHRPTGAIKEFPGNKTEDLRADDEMLYLQCP